MSFKTKLAELIIEDGEIDLCNLLNVTGWPRVKEDPDEDDSAMERLDMENHSIVSFDDNSLKIAAGGDWQEPLTVTIELVEGELKVTGTSDGYENNNLEDKLLEFLS